MIPGCNTCKHWNGFVACRAYPKGIPFPIMAGEIPHLESIPGKGKVPSDGGVFYEPIDNQEAIETLQKD